jgi:endonuclease-8
VPEGDTIFRTARSLDQALAGKTLVRFEAPRLRFRPFPPDTVVDGAEAVGKHCLVRFDDGRTLHTHMRMTGSWHLYRPGERWRKKPAAMRALVEVPDWVAVCFAAPIVELTDHPPIDHLGPDLCRPDADIDEAVRRLDERGGEIGDALLDQRVAAGIGNMWRCEALFACRVNPFDRVDELPDATNRALLDVAARLLRSSVVGDRPPMQVYGRRAEPCKRCGTRIDWRPQGEQRRGTYWCPACQPRTGGTEPG